MKKEVLIESCWTIGSFLRSAARKFEEIERGLLADDRQRIREYAAQFTKQKDEANMFASMFENASKVTVETEEE